MANDKIRNVGKSIKKVVTSTPFIIILGSIIGGVGGTYLGDKAVEKANYNMARNKVEQILEVDGKKGLSDSEIRRFYDESGISPYTHPFKTLSRADLEKFLSNYELRWVRK